MGPGATLGSYTVTSGTYALLPLGFFGALWLVVFIVRQAVACADGGDRESRRRTSQVMPAAASEKQRLPPGWKEYRHGKGGAPYYVNTRTKETTW